jgi:integrase
MAPRPRDPRRRGLPPNLYERDGYFYWRNPLDGKKHGLGRDRLVAMNQGVEANLLLASQVAQVRLVDRLRGGNTLGDWLDRYKEKLDEKLAEGELAPESHRQRAWQLRAIRESALSGLIIERVETKAVVDFLKPWTKANKKATASSLRSFLKKVFRAAEAEGWIPRGSNPVAATEAISWKVKRARLTLEAFQKIYAAAQTLEPWIARSMELALVTAQRREDIAGMRFADIRDGRLWVQQKKTKAKLCIPLALTLYPLHLSLEEVIRRCRDLAVSRHLLHFARAHGHAKPGKPVSLVALTKGFAKARDLTDLEWKVSEPPSLHEMRSLAARLYDQQGVDSQVLLGHKDPATTALYRDNRGAEWMEVKV